MQTQVFIDNSRLIRALERIGNRNVPFAVARALTDTAKVVQEDARGRLARIFKIRTTWVSRGLRVRSSDWKTAPHLEAAVGTVDKFMALQQTGGMKDPKDDMQGIPKAGSALVGGMNMPRGTAGERTTTRGANWPRQLVKAIQALKAAKAAGKRSRNRAAKNKLVFLEHADIPTIAVRVSTGRGTKGQFKPLWFLFKRSVKIPKRWDFLERGELVARRNLERILHRRIREEISGSR